MQELKPIRVFLEVSRLESFAAAAKSLRMTPASVTRIIARLEQDIGQQLLVRTTRQVSLTSAGAFVAARYTPLIESFDRVEQELDSEVRLNRGRLSINAPMSFGLRLMPRLLDSFRQTYPEIDLNVRLTDELVDIVTENCDLAIRISEPPTDKSTIWRKLCAVPMRVVASPKLFETNPKPVTPDDLDSRLCLSYGYQDVPEQWRFSQGAVKKMVSAGTTVHTNNGDLLYELARLGAGIVVLPEFHIAHGIQTDEIITLLEDWTLPPLWLSLYYPPYVALPPLVATFTEFFELYLQRVEGFEY